LEKKKLTTRNYWPHAVVGFMFVGFGLITWTIDVALDNPVQMDNRYLSDKKDVDENINEILIAGINFDKKYHLDFPNKFLTKGENEFLVNLQTQDGVNIDSAKFDLILTRPHTVVDDKKINVESLDDGNYSFVVDIPKDGRWSIYGSVEVDGLKKFIHYKTKTF
jgi:hypothetical protein